MRRRGASAAFARNPELQIGFGTLCELILGGLAPKGPKRQPQAVQRLFKNGSKEPKGWIRGAQGTQKAATGSPRAPQREPMGFRELSLYTYIHIYIYIYIYRLHARINEPRIIDFGLVFL